MPKAVAVTHADLAPSRKSTELGSKTGVVFIVFTIICGLFCFILCLIAEATRSQEKWVETGDDGKGVRYQCVYSGSGKTPLCVLRRCVRGTRRCDVGGAYVHVDCGSKSPAAGLLGTLIQLVSRVSHGRLRFSLSPLVGEILLLIGLSVESGHLNNWSRPREGCLIIREGLFSAAGVLTLMTVFLAAGLYLTALHAQKMFQHHQRARQLVLETSVLYGSPPHPLTTMAREDPVITELPNHPPRFSFSGDFGKQFNGV
ncbi:Far1-related sequence 11 isoform 1 [Hibiscus syriacus]|uniref:Far1-related sequence 11 isoform 1 n=1 Tax=Hibiscus syriacus TaxID=106335 RepID=A0A6A3B7X2_HIBSY|nr:Far1-related sequence 11 isoform 1 [Hibiscus syriacus]